MKNNDTYFEQLYKKAWDAGVAAATKKVPTPMVVGTATTPFGNDIDYAKETYYISDGACGFAWVKVRPANGSFGRWLKKTKKVNHVAYTGGYDIWISAYNQSMDRKFAHAVAMAQVLKDAGINAYADERMD